MTPNIEIVPKGLVALTMLEILATSVLGSNFEPAADASGGYDISDITSFTIPVGTITANLAGNSFGSSGIPANYFQVSSSFSYFRPLNLFYILNVVGRAEWTQVQEHQKSPVAREWKRFGDF